MTQADFMAPSGKPKLAPIRRTAVVTTSLLLLAACTDQAERTPAEDSAASPSVTSSTSVLQGTTTTKASEADTGSTIKSSQDAPEDAPDLASFAQAVGAETVVAQVDSILHIYQDEQQSSQLLGPMVCH